MSYDRQKLIDAIDMEHDKWTKNSQNRKYSLAKELQLINTMPKTTVVNKLVNIYNNDISNNEGPLTAIDNFDYFFLCSIFENARIVQAERFIYLPETMDVFRRNNKRTHTADILPRQDKVFAIQKYDSSCERICGYQFTSMYFSHCNCTQPMKFFILCLIRCSAHENVLHATSAIPLYKVKIDE